MNAPRLVAVGDNCLDAYLTRNQVTVGGNALNVAVQWQRNGWTARYFGAVGADPEGDLVCEAVAATGLDPADVERRSGETAVTLLSDRAGDRHFLLEAFGVGTHYMPSPERYAAAAAADWVHLGTNASPELVRRLVADRVPFSVDLSTAPFALPLAGVPMVFASGPSAPGEPVAPLIAALRRAGAGTVVLTCGRRGAYFDDGRVHAFAPATQVEVVDTCGAGDSFIATFITAFCCQHLPAGDALARASAAAAQTCTHLGGFPQPSHPIPDWLPVKYAAVIAGEPAPGVKNGG